MEAITSSFAGRADNAAGRVDGGLHPAERQAPPFITQAMSIVRRRKWVILGSLVGALVIGLVVTLLMTPRYTASTTIEIQREQASPIDVKGANPTAPLVDQEFYQTQYGLLKSQSLAERVATTLRLTDSPAFFVTSGNKHAANWFRNGVPTPDAPSRADRERIAGQILNAHVSIDPERLSRLVQIRFTSPDPLLSKRVVDAWAQSFIQITLERRYEASSYVRRFLEQRLAQLRQRIDQSESQLVDYASRQGIVNVPGAAGANGVETGERPLVAENLAALNRNLTEATAARIQAESRLGHDLTSEALSSQAISLLRQRRAELAADYARLMTQFEPGYPQARAIQNQIAQIDKALTGEEARVGGVLRQTYESAQATERMLRERVEAAQSGVIDFRRRSIQYNIIQRDADTNRQLYDALLQQYKAIGVSGGVGVNNISIVDEAKLPERPSSPIIWLNLILALFVGLAIGTAAAWLLEQIDQGITDPSEIENLLGIPLLGTIPKVDGETPTAALDDRKSAIGEAYASLQTRLSFSTDHGMPRVLAVTSSRAAEGKSTSSYALAHLLARAGKQVLLIDADMRSPSIHDMFGLSNVRGFSNYLSGSDDLADLISPSRFDRLHVMTAGPNPPSAPELLSSERLPILLQAARQRFDYVVIDAPPVLGLADAPLLGSRAEGVIMIVESRVTQKGTVQVAIRRLAAAHSPLLGVVLTKFDARGAHYGYGYDYGYGYGYGGKDRDKAAS